MPKTTQHPYQSDIRLTKRMAELQGYGVAPSTRRTYHVGDVGVTSYLAFCRKYGINPLPASELTLRYFCTELSRSLSHSTIKVYLAGIRLFHIENNCPEPTKEAPLLHYLCTAIKRHTGENYLNRHPITISLLQFIKTSIFHRHRLPFHDRLLFWAAFTLAFYGFLRASEYTSPTPSHYNRHLHLLKKDITIREDRMLICIKGSKTDQFRKRASILISKTGTSTCPVTAMNDFLKHSHCHSLHFRMGNFSQDATFPP